MIRHSSAPPLDRAISEHYGGIVGRRAIAVLLALAACRERPDPPASAGAPVSADAAPPPAARTAPPPPMPAALPAAAARLVEGKVLDLAGYAVAGASVVAGDATARTEEDGRFSLRTAASRLEVAAPGYRTRVLSPGPGAARVAIVLTPVGTIGGGISGAPSATVLLAGSGVWPPRRTEADRLGRFAFDDVPEGVYELMAFAGTVATPVVTGIAVEGPGGAATADMTAGPAATLTGRVTAGGAPLAGARVTVTPGRLSLLGADAVTDASGRYRVPGLAPGTWWLRVEGSGFAPGPPQRVEVWLPGAEANVALSLGGRIEGRVLAHDGEPASGARLRVQVSRPDGPVTRSGSFARARAAVAALRRGDAALPAPPLDRTFAADAQGRFSLTGVTPGVVRVLAWHPRSAPSASRPVDLADGERAQLTIRLERPCAIEGRVLDDLGNPVDGARVIVRGPRAELGRRILHAGEGGRFRVERLPPGPALIWASSPGLVPAHRTIDLRPDREAELELRLGRGGLVLEGLCAGPEGDPLPGVRVTLLGGAPQARTAITDEVGHFRFESLPPAAYQLRAEHPDHPPATIEGVDGTLPIEIRLGGGGEITGRVSAGGNAVEGAAVTARRMPEPGEGAGAFVSQARADPEGAFRLPALPPGRYVVGVEAPGFERFERAGVEVREASATELPVTLAPVP
jgi:hypothetical protein